jgi:acylpyruvate hydrolase
MYSLDKYHSDHIKELSSATPRQPFFFLKPPSSILLPGAGPVLRPRGVTMHYEVELGLIMGKTVRDLDPDDTKGAMDAIEGTVYLLLRFNYHPYHPQAARNVVIIV